MTDHPIDLLAALTAAVGEARSRDYGNASRVLAEHRDALAADAEQTARAADAPIHDARAIMLLFDVLVGITTGTLRHEQQIWVLEVRRPVDGYACGTYRCLAGWLAYIAFPGITSVATWKQLHPGEPTVEYTAATYQGTWKTYGQWARQALGDVGEEQYPVAKLFAASATLADLWGYAGELTGGAITIPSSLAEKVAATVDHLDDVRWVQA
jgi:hypothetical protein